VFTEPLPNNETEMHRLADSPLIRRGYGRKLSVQYFSITGCAFVAKFFFTEPLPSAIHIQEYGLTGGIYEVRCRDGPKSPDINTMFNKNSFNAVGS
jgi:hypothetical protein